MKIASFIASGNGANILHQCLAQKIDNYKLYSYSPKWEYAPFLIPLQGVGKIGKADIVHASPDNGLFFYSRKKPLVLTVHSYMLDDFMIDYSTTVQRIHYKTDLKLFTKASLKLADRIVCVSQFLFDIVTKHHDVAHKTELIYNGVDQAFFTPSLENSKKGVFKVFFSGNLSLRKGAQCLKAIADKLDPGIEILYTSGLRNYPELGACPNMRCIGSIPYKEMPQIYQQCNLLLAPTVREGFGLGVAEAMASGLPVVASNCSAIPELVADGEGGMLCPVGDVDAFANAINKLASDPTTCKQMGDYNREKIVKQFTLTKMLDAYKELFVKTLDNK
jgi:glycosyltransferase involved in cell wall biosynthesis